MQSEDKPLRTCNKTIIIALTREETTSWIVLGHIVAKTIPQQPTAAKTQGKTQSNNRGNNSPQTTMNSQHTIPTAITGELTQTENGKEQTPNLCVREYNIANKTMEEKTTTIPRWSNRTLHSMPMVEKIQTLCMNRKMDTLQTTVP